MNALFKNCNKKPFIIGIHYQHFHTSFYSINVVCHLHWCASMCICSLYVWMTSSNGNIFRVTGPLCGGGGGGGGCSPVTGEFPTQRPATRSFDVFFDLPLNKRLGKQSRHRWFQTPWRSLWRHCNNIENIEIRVTGLCAGNSPVTGEYPAQMASNAENVSIWWRHCGISLWWNLPVTGGSPSRFKNEQ